MVEQFSDMVDSLSPVYHVARCKDKSEIEQAEDCQCLDGLGHGAIPL